MSEAGAGAGLQVIVTGVSQGLGEALAFDLLERGAQRAREAMDAKLTALCASQVPGDTYRHLCVSADYSTQTFKHILAPVWLLSYTYGPRRFQCVMNGVTGAVRGEYPKSPWKIALLVLAIIVAVVIVMTLGGRQ